MEQNIENIIFDFGGVIMDINPAKTQQEFTRLSCMYVFKPKSVQDFQELVDRFEKGLIDSKQFRDETREILALKKIDDKLFDAAWNMLLLDIPPQRMALLDALSTRYKLYLLSNTNLIHYQSFSAYIQQKFKNKKLEDFFEKTYLSFNMGARKPDPAIYKAMIDDSWMVPAKSLFIDDTEANVKAAVALGIRGHHLKPGESVTMIFDKELNFTGKKG